MSNFPYRLSHLFDSSFYVLTYLPRKARPPALAFFFLFLALIQKDGEKIPQSLLPIFAFSCGRDFEKGPPGVAGRREKLYKERSFSVKKGVK